MTVTQQPRAVDRAQVRRDLRRARRAYLLRQNGIAYLFLLPNLIFFVVFLLVPMGWVIKASFETGGILGPAEWVGLDNWREALDDPALIRSFRQTLAYTLMAVPASIAVALALALLLREVRRGGRWVRAAVYAPSLSPVVVAGVIWLYVVHPDFGLLNFANRAVGAEPINWLGDAGLALPAIALLEVWHSMGFWALLLLAGLVSIPSDLYHAAAIDGASAVRRFWHVTLPSMRPVLTICIVLAALVAMQVFDSVVILTFGGPAGATDTAVFYIYRSVFQSANPGFGAVQSLMLLALILLLTAILLRALQHRAGGR